MRTLQPAKAQQTDRRETARHSAIHIEQISVPQHDTAAQWKTARIRKNGISGCWTFKTNWARLNPLQIRAAQSNTTQQSAKQR